MSEFAHIKAGHLGDLARNTWLDTIDIDLDSLRLFQDEPGMGNELRWAALEQAADDPVALYDVADRNEQTSGTPLLYTGLKKLALAEQANGWDDPDANTLTWLYGAADQREVIGSAFAQAWLNALGEAQPEEIITLPDPFKSLFAANSRKNGKRNDPILMLFPNPAADDGFRAAYRLPDDLPNAKLTFKDILGRTIWSHTSGTGVQLVDVPVGALPNGLYFCSLVVDNAPLVSEKLMIAR